MANPYLEQWTAGQNQYRLQNPLSAEELTAQTNAKSIGTFWFPSDYAAQIEYANKYSPSFVATENQRAAEQRAQAESAYNSGSGALGTLGAIGFGAIGTLVGGPVLGGAMAGAVKGLSSSPSAGFEEGIKGAGTGAAMGYVGGQLSSELSDMAGYQPGVADAVWSEAATPASSLATQAGIRAGTNLLTNTAKSGVYNILGGSTPIRTAGGNMATQGTTPGMNLQDLSNILTPLLGMYTSNKQGNQMNTAYGQGVNMITTPSPDQQFYRTELQKMFTDPSSFYQGEPYKAALGQGQQTTERALNAQGLTGSGRELAELQKYGQSFGWDQMMKQAGLFGQLSGVADDGKIRAVGGQALINQGKSQADVTGAMAGDATKGAANLLSGGLTGSNQGGTTLASLLEKANSWFPSGTTGGTDWLTQSGSTTDAAQLQDLLGQQDSFNWSGVEDVIGGSTQDMMLNDQWDWSW